MHQVLSLLRKDIRLFLRNKVAFGLTFIVPIIMIYIFGQVFGGMGSSGSGPSGIPLALIFEAESTLASAITKSLETESAFRIIKTWADDAGVEVPLTEARVRELIADNQLRFALILPTDLLGEEEFGINLRLLTNPRSDIETQMVNGLLQKAIFTSAPQALMGSLRQSAVDYIGEEGTNEFYTNLSATIVESFGLDPAETKTNIDAGMLNLGSSDGDPSSKSSGSLLTDLVNIEQVQLVGAEVKSPQATRSVGGWAIMFLLFSVTGASTSLFEEKKSGIFHRLLSSPVRRSHILWSKYLFNVMLGTVQLLVLFLAGQLLFDIEVVNHLPELFVIILAAATAATAFGMLLASIAPNPEAAQGLATFLILSMSAVGGAWFPTSIMPEFIQTISKVTLVYWSMEGFLAVLWAQNSLWEILPYVGVLLGMSAAVSAFSLWRFNRGNLFD
jgi:ABC-2 type transport system permease protein